jgi:hypothetical protein
MSKRIMSNRDAKDFVGKVWELFYPLHDSCSRLVYCCHAEPNNNMIHCWDFAIGDFQDLRISNIGAEKIYTEGQIIKLPSCTDIPALIPSMIKAYNKTNAIYHDKTNNLLIMVPLAWSFSLEEKMKSADSTIIVPFGQHEICLFRYSNQFYIVWIKENKPHAWRAANDWLEVVDNLLEWNYV